MPDYKEMYLKMVNATEAAINTLIAVQRECEELYINSPDPEITFLPRVISSEDVKKESEDG